MKGKVSRTLAAKAALCIRFDALGILIKLIIQRWVIRCWIWYH